MLLAHKIELRPTAEQADYLTVPDALRRDVKCTQESDKTGFRSCTGSDGVNGAGQRYVQILSNGMAKNRKLARAVNDAGMGTLRRMIEYKAELRGVDVPVIGRFTPTSKPCSQCGQLHDMPLGKDVMDCDCGNVMDRDLNAAINIDFLGRAALLRDPKRTQESGKTSASVDALAMTA